MKQMPNPHSHQRKVTFPVTLLSLLIGTFAAFHVGQLSSDSVLKLVAGIGPLLVSHDVSYSSNSGSSRSCKAAYDLNTSPQSVRTLGTFQNDMNSNISYYDCEIQKDGSINVVPYNISKRSSSQVFYEVFVHPAMLMHIDPKRVAVIGRGEGNAIKEVLKHKTVNKVKMMGVDKDVVKTSKEWKDGCNDIIQSSEWCRDDGRVEFIYEDARHWFSSRNPINQIHPIVYDKETFDIMIVDILNFPFVEEFYDDDVFIQSLFESITDNGIIAFHIGKSSKYTDPDDEFTNNSRRKSFIDLLSESGFQEVFMYEDANVRSDNDNPSLFLLAAKDWSSRSLWFRNSAQVDFEIYKRIQASVSGKPLLEYFDGSVLEAFRAPHRVMETLYCRTSPTPMECIQSKKLPDIPLSNLRVGPSSIGDGSGRGVFTDVDIKEGSTIARKSSSYPINFPPSAYDLMLNYHDISVDHQALYNYMDGYGWESEFWGRTSYFVDTSILTFVNHGCHGSYNIGDPPQTTLEDGERTTEQNATFDDLEESIHDKLFNPFRFRHMEPMFEKAIRDIKAGDELFCDYSFFTTGKNFDLALDELKKMCNGEKSIGLITQVEMRKKLHDQKGKKNDEQQ